MQRQPYIPKSNQQRDIDAALTMQRSTAYMRSIAPILTDEAFEAIEDECYARMLIDHDPVLCRMLVAVRSLRKENEELRTAHNTFQRIEREHLEERVFTGVEKFIERVSKAIHDHQPEQPD